LKRLVASFGAASGAHWGVSSPEVTQYDQWWDYVRTKAHIIDYIWTFTIESQNKTGFGSVAVGGDAES